MRVLGKACMTSQFLPAMIIHLYLSILKYVILLTDINKKQCLILTWLNLPSFLPSSFSYRFLFQRMLACINSLAAALKDIRSVCVCLFLCSVWLLQHWRLVHLLVTEVSVWGGWGSALCCRAGQCAGLVLITLSPLTVHHIDCSFNLFWHRHHAWVV